MASVSRRLLLLALFVATPLACGRNAPAALTIVHFNDVYEIGPVEGGRAGGLARVATVIKDLRQTHAPVMTTLGGDYLSPSALGTARVDGQAIGGRQMVDVLNAMGLEWATLGNHEFDLQEPAFRARLDQSKFRIVSSNVTDANGQLFPKTEAFAVVPVQVGGRALRIGLIGITIDSNPRPWVRYTPYVEAATAAIAKIRATGPVDAIIALTHLSLDEDRILVTAVPDIDVSLGGHEHENWLIYRGADLTPIVKADANVRTVAVVSLSFPELTRPVVSVSLRPITSEITPDTVVDAEVQRWTTAAFNAFKADGFQPERVIATLTTPLDGREATVRNRSGNLTALLTDAIAKAADPVDVAIMNGGSIRIDDVLPVGPVSEYDVIRVLPFGGAVTKATMPGSLLAQVLNVGLKNQGTGGYLHAWGATLQNGKWLVQGKPLNPSMRYRVGLTDFLLSGREANLDFLTRTNPLIRDVQDLADIRQVLIAELGRAFPVSRLP
jgi:5'-nucleotidase/UDP-sugar diphosphatase